MKRTKKEILSHITEPIHKAHIVANNTLKIEYMNGTVAIRLHDTDIITWKDEKIFLNSGGWRTRTTKERMEQFSPVKRINQINGVWFIGKNVFYDGCEVNVVGEFVSAPAKFNMDKVNALKKKITKYVNLITKDNLPQPDSGDCWYCSMRVIDGGKPLGDATNSHDHLHEHLKESYLHGSIIINAMRELGYSDQSIGIHYYLKAVGNIRRAVRRYLQKRLIANIAIK
jgi:hypothetical protein